jgi:hypothetical protein
MPYLTEHDDPLIVYGVIQSISFLAKGNYAISVDINIASPLNFNGVQTLPGSALLFAKKLKFAIFELPYNKEKITKGLDYFLV